MKKLAGILILSFLGASQSYGDVWLETQTIEYREVRKIEIGLEIESLIEDEAGNLLASGFSSIQTLRDGSKEEKEVYVLYELIYKVGNAICQDLGWSKAAVVNTGKEYLIGRAFNILLSPEAKFEFQNVFSARKKYGLTGTLFIRPLESVLCSN